MSYSIEYFHFHVQTEIESWPDGILADYARRTMGKGLFEFRPKGREGIGRAFYCFLVGPRVIILHAFIKKTPATPEPELKIARKRIMEVQNG